MAHDCASDAFINLFFTMSSDITTSCRHPSKVDVRFRLYCVVLSKLSLTIPARRAVLTVVKNGFSVKPLKQPLPSCSLTYWRNTSGGARHCLISFSAGNPINIHKGGSWQLTNCTRFKWTFRAHPPTTKGDFLQLFSPSLYKVRTAWQVRTA